MIFLHLQNASGEKVSKRDSENKQYFKYQMTHLMGDTLSRLSRVLPLVWRRHEAVSSAAETSSRCYSVIGSIILALLQHI